MSETKGTHHLRLVGEPPTAAPDQLSLPFVEDAFMIMLANVTNAPEQGFMRLLQRVYPNVVVDLRIVPRFDFGRLTRKIVFRHFEEISARYHDLTYTLGAKDHRDAILNPAFVAGPLGEILAKAPQPRRVLLLLDDDRALLNSLRVLPERLTSQPRGGWQIRESTDL